MALNNNQSVSSLEAEIAREDELRDAVYRFNVRPITGILHLVSVLGADRSPQSIAHIMHMMNGLEGTKIGEYLSKPENAEILRCYFRELDLRKPFLESMRVALSGRMQLPQESNAIDQCLTIFAEIYCEQNTDTKLDFNSANILAVSVVMLNTDLHSPNILRRMTPINFISNIRGCLNQESISDMELVAMYNDIKEHEFMYSGKSRVTLALCAPEIKGWLAKKQDSWRSYWTQHFFVLTNSCLYYFPKAGNDTDPLGIIQLTDVQITEHDPEKHRILIDAGTREIQYVKFQKRRPTRIGGVKRIFLEVRDGDYHKWFYRIRQSVVYSNFNNQSSAHMGRNLVDPTMSGTDAESEVVQI